MRTTITLDDTLAKEVRRLVPAGTDAKAISLALEDWVLRKKMDALADLRGTMAWRGDLDALRAMEVHESRGGYGRRAR